MGNSCKACNTELPPQSRGRPRLFCQECRAFRDDALKWLWSIDNKDHKAEYHQKRMQNQEYRENRIIKNRQHRANDPDYAKKYKLYRTENKKRINKTNSIRRQRPHNKIKRLAETRNRQARKLNATPAWINKGYIELFYKGAKLEEARTGLKVEVDHIIPLQHDLVCGLHCEDNLQWLTKTANLQKSNSFIV